ncbi:MAG TPA: sigma 54-interacting transcriptional regulator [Myxococcales bacterium]|jgi:transcriptional regulator with PAS, ATPase and Fis domain
MSSAPEASITADESGVEEPQLGAGASLTRALWAEQPLSPALRFVLPESGRVVIGREREGPRDDAYLAVPDRFASAPHASIERSYGRWILQDEQSKHGCFVDGVDVDRCELRDGAIVEMGRSFFVFREAAPSTRVDCDGLHTFNAAYAARLESLAKMARTALPIVLRGESGTGKEVLARAVHRLSGRSGAFQAVNCAALAQSLAESELFGYRKGAFSGATEDRPGLIRSAQGGTLFLDEIGDLPLPLQGHFLRVLQESEVTPVGATRAIPVEFRLVAATHRDLEKMAASGAFRADLLARIGGFTLELPPLRERKEDLGTLVAALLRRHAGAGTDRIYFSLAAARALVHHDFRLNVRELEKALAVAVTLSEQGRIDVAHLPPGMPAKSETTPPPKTLSPHADERREQLIELLRLHKGNIAEVARAVGKARMQIHRWMKRYGLNAADYR